MVDKKDLIKALYESSYEYFSDEKFFIYKEKDVCGYLVRIEQVAKRIAGVDDVLFLKQEIRGKCVFSPGELGRDVLRFAWYYLEIKKHYPLHKFSPYVEAFFNAFKELRERFQKFSCQIAFGEQLDEVIDFLNGMVDDFRRVVSSDEFKVEMNRHARSSNKNHKSLVRYVNALFNLKSRLLVIRLDLGYAKRDKSSLMGADIGYAEVKKHRENFFKEVRKKLPNGAFAGFCWKLEYGLSKSFHYHVMIFLDGAKLREDVSLGKIFGEIWRDKITSGGGVYFNCNHKKASYRSCGIGMINHDDVELRQNLVKAATYLTKLELYIKIVLDRRGRSFGRGEMPDLSQSGRGRPRGRLGHEKTY